MAGGFTKELCFQREAWGWDENWTVSEWPITNDRPTDCTLIIQRWYGNGGHLLCKAQTVPSHNQYPLLSNMPFTWLPPLSTIEALQAECMGIMSVCMCTHGNGELFQHTVETLTANVMMCLKRSHYERATFYMQTKLPINMKFPCLDCTGARQKSQTWHSNIVPNPQGPNVT